MKHTRNFNSFINESAKSDKLVPLMVKAIEKVDDSLSYTDLAIAVADIIKEQYGDHNIAPFMKELHKQLGLKESVNEDEEVFMATNSLNKIIDDASELLDKIGEEEINLPAWIQDHITKAEECLNHANQGFYVEEGLDEMAKSDVHYKEIMAMYNSGSFAKKKVAVVLCKNPNATLKQIEDVLGDAGYEEMVEFVDELGIKESKDSDTFEGNPGEDKRMVDIRAFRGSVKDLTDFIEDKVKESQK